MILRLASVKMLACVEELRWGHIVDGSPFFLSL